ncbi:PREDICTED: uncharacterized protein LOC108534718 isoform X2 [Rhinopithecus bieti]|uniref:uncharacterized protein LOC108534718 isoform X2 n=1 Tax=Rhinopithecus bieti TaxID=61621 RepID=UPI00083C2EC2|nr:PREDICTED: uncharacterized protein LOC108534718 isoform X2 [Rhinopithecus bieti]
MTHGDCLTSSNSGGRGKSQRTQPRRAPFLPCPEPPGSSPASTGLQKKREQEFPAVVLQQLERGGHAQQTATDASRLRAKTAQADAQTGLPHPGHGGSELGSPGNPGFRRKPPGTQSPSAAPIWGRTWGPDACGNQGLPKIPGGGVTSQPGTQPVRGAREHSVCPNPAP